MKKVLAVALVLCLVFGAAFAKSKIEIGVQAGYGNEYTQLEGSEASISVPSVSNTRMVALSQGAFYAALTGSFGIAEDIAIKAEVGINTMGHLKEQMTLNGSSGGEVTYKNPTPMNFNFYLGGEYNIDFSSGFGFAAGLGLDIMYGKEAPLADEAPNGRIGFAVEAIGKYEISKNIKINLGGRFAVHFLNTGDTSKAYIAKLIKDGKDWVDSPVVGVSKSFSHFQGGFSVFAGVTYSL